MLQVQRERRDRLRFALVFQYGSNRTWIRGFGGARTNVHRTASNVPHARLTLGKKSFTTWLKYVIYITLMPKPRNTRQAAGAVGISNMTLHRWVAAKRLKAPKLRIRNGRAVRLWGKTDLDRLNRLKQEIYCKGRGRKKGYKRK